MKMYVDAPTWDYITQQEPKVATAFAELEMMPNRRPYERWHAFVDIYGTTPKAYLTRLVGFQARNPNLRSQEAYRIVMSRLWDAVL